MEAENDPDDQSSTNESDVPLILVQEDLKNLLSQNNQQVIGSILKDVDKITKICFGMQPVSDLSIRKTALNILTPKKANYPAKIAKVPDLMENIGLFIKNIDSYTTNDISAWCQVLQFYSELTGGTIFNIFPDKRKFLKRTLPYIAFDSIYSLLYYISDEGHKATRDFLSKIHATSVLYNSLGNDAPNDRILQLLINIVSSSDGVTPLVAKLGSTKKVDFILDMAIQSDDVTVQNKSLRLLFELCNQCDESERDDEDSLFSKVFMHVVERVDDLSRFITSGNFCSAKDRAIDLLIGMLATLDEAPPAILDTIGILFISLLEKPLLNLKHCAMLRLFNAYTSIHGIPEDTLEKYSIREKIISADPQLPSIGFIHEIANTICEKEKKEQTDEWKEYINGPLAEINRIKNIRYGGPLPERKHKDFEGFEVLPGEGLPPSHPIH